MHPTLYAARLGLGRGWTEVRHYLTNPQDLAWNLFVVAVFVVVLLFQRDATVEGTALPLAMLTLPGILGLAAISYPITALPGWVQGIAQAFRTYWLGLGIRSALLPDAAAAVELTGSWRYLATAAVLGPGSWAGLLIAPGVLRRMARRESGSSMEARRLQHLQRV
jgi:hypothetical protein